MPERQSTNDNNPFAPPPEGRPDQPWQPRRPEGSDDDTSGSSGSPDGSGSEPGGSSGASDGRWSPRQPGRSTDGFGRGPDRRGGPEGGPGQGGPGREKGMRWDPTDPAQRRARYAILAGMWAFFFAIFEIPELALLLGALGLYWGISSLRAKPKEAGAAQQADASAASPASPVSPASPASPASSSEAPVPAPAAVPVRSMRTAAISGLVASSVALMIVAVGFTMQVVYQDFYECRDDALTHAGQLACNDLLPKPLRAGFGVRE
ncbi:hypothetical protein [Streptomyces gardneri]|uniref:Integral membrane protein n=1 Tax=Streptomyces gardneri TaxID=66892 RepID=A0A4Y3RF71_9ACTN|nr:hypothetical protein [Streptomyces gardneri]GEB56416.1 hypothetical protein SGA01_20210 [Streptomyces gardneri]GHH11376.1 hypothetical protein GCM10017674_56600 [Streptomyces gardneri]